MEVGTGTNQPVQWFLGGKGLRIQRGTSVHVGSPTSGVGPWEKRLFSMVRLHGPWCEPALNIMLSDRGDFRAY